MLPWMIFSIGFFAFALAAAACVGFWKFVRRGGRLTPIEQAYVAYDAGRKDRAALIVDRVLRRTPHSETALYLRVLIHLEERDPTALAEEVRRMIPKMKRPAGTALLLAQAFLKGGDETSARYWFELARTDPNFEAHLEAMPLRDQLAMRLGGQERSYQ